MVGFSFGTLNALAVGTGVTSGGWGRGCRGRDAHHPPGPAARESGAPLDRQHPGGCPRVVVGLSCESGQDTFPPFAKLPPPPLGQKGEKEKLGKVCT